MGLLKYVKYGIRFLFLQTLLTFFTIFYFDRFLIGDYFDGYLIIRDNLLEDRDRFYPFVTNDFIKTDIYIAIFIFVFLVILYSTKFYTYVNELSFSLDRKYFDEFLSIYLLWTSSIFVFFYIFRFSILSRANLILFTFLVPLILIIFRNSEVLSNFLGRSTSKENYISFNLENDSIFRKLRIITFRNSIGEFNFTNINEIIDIIDKQNKENNLNLIILNLGLEKSLPESIEEYLIDLNKKVLIISRQEIIFKNIFLKRSIFLENYFLTYFNNDIQYGSKYILKRALDVFVALIMIVLLFPIYTFVAFFIILKDGFPFLIKQNRVGLHGKLFQMYKFRTMKNDSHTLRKDLKELNKGKGPLFKIENDPRVINGANFIRDFSLDEIPQLINVLKGDMSIVGPRPLFDEDTKLFDTRYMRRLNVMPGITGLLQINDRNTDDFSVWFKYDLSYIENWSIYLDLKIMFQTPLAVFKKNKKGL
jgi:lipopolysaccharide/colanic/teichoic acid biosynthesis glycosyltransferase